LSAADPLPPDLCDSNPTKPDAWLWVGGVAFELALVPLAAACGWFVGIVPWSRLHFSLPAFGWGLLATLPLLALFTLLMRIKSPALTEPLRWIQEALLELTGPNPSPAILALLALAAGAGEEILFRGFLQDWLATKTSFPLALLAASLAFGLLHPFTWWYVLLAASIGAYLGALYEFTGSLLPPILAHFLYDWVALGALLRADLSLPIRDKRAAGDEALPSGVKSPPDFFPSPPPPESP
jgi:membrane protease YdiL (CAAX protease family)